MKKKGFTLIELLAVIVLLGIILVIATLSYNNYLIKSKEKSFALAENSFQDALLDAYSYCEANFNPTNNNFCQNHKQPNKENETDKIKLSELIEEQYIEDIKDPYGKCDKYDNENSEITITLKRKVKVNEETGKPYEDSEIPDKAKNYQCNDGVAAIIPSEYYYCDYEYTICLKCSKTDDCVTK